MPPPRKRIIFVVDDNAALLRTCELALNRAGYHVVTAPNGSYAMEVLAHTSSIDLLLCDVFMPGKGGLEVIQSVRRKIPNVPIIAMSGGGAVSAEDVLEQCRKLGARAILTKPFTAEQLTTAVAGALVPHSS